MARLGNAQIACLKDQGTVRTRCSAAAGRCILAAADDRMAPLRKGESGTRSPASKAIRARCRPRCSAAAGAAVWPQRTMRRRRCGTPKLRAKRKFVEHYAKPENWVKLEAGQLQELSGEVAGLPSAASDTGLEAKLFDALMLRLQLARLRNGRDFPKLAARVRELAEALEATAAIPMVAQRLAPIQEIQTDEFWQDVTIVRLEAVRKQLRDLVKFTPILKTSAAMTCRFLSQSVAAVRASSASKKRSATFCGRAKESCPPKAPLRFGVNPPGPRRTRPAACRSQAWHRRKL